MASGQDAVIGLARQNSWGTAANTDSLHHVPLLSEDVNLQRPDLLSGNLNSRLDENDGVAGPRQVAGTISAEIAPKALGVLIQSVLGPPTTTTSGSGVAAHVFQPATADFGIYAAVVPHTYYKKFSNVSTGDLDMNLVGNELELSVRNGELVQCRVAFLGGTHAFQSSLGLTAEDPELIPWSVSSVSIGGTAKSNIRDLSLAVNNNAESMHALDGSTYPNRVKRTGKREIRISGTLFFDDASEYVDFINGTTRELVATFTGDDEIQSGYYNTLEIIVPQMKYSAVPLAITGPEELEVSFEARGEYNTGSGTALQITLTNSWQAGY